MDETNLLHFLDLSKFGPEIFTPPRGQNRKPTCAMDAKSTLFFDFSSQLPQVSE
jgi:hypothetical protein